MYLEPEVIGVVIAQTTQPGLTMGRVKFSNLGCEAVLEEDGQDISPKQATCSR